MAWQEKKGTLKLKGSRADTNRTVHIADAGKYALRLLSYRPRSRKEMRGRLLLKGFDASEITSAMSFLEKAGLMHDEILAPALLKNALEKRYLGKRGAEMFLRKRGIERDLIQKTLLNMPDDAEKDAAVRFVNKKLKTLRSHQPDKIKQKLWGMLSRRGFSANVIHKAIKAVERTAGEPYEK